MNQYNTTKISASFFAASSAWYISLLLAAYLSRLHTSISQPIWLYKIYWSAFYDEYQQHLFYIVFIGLSILFGFMMRLMPPISVKKNKDLIVGTLVSVLLMP